MAVITEGWDWVDPVDVEHDPIVEGAYVGTRDRVFLDGVPFTLEGEPPTAT